MIYASHMRNDIFPAEIGRNVLRTIKNDVVRTADGQTFSVLRSKIAVTQTAKGSLGSLPKACDSPYGIGGPLSHFW